MKCDITCLCLTHGRAHVLPEAIESYLKQDYKGDTELLIINDCPEQPLYLETSADVGTIKIYNIDEPMNLNEKMDFGVEFAESEWIAVWEDDDIMFPWRLRQAVEESEFKRPYRETRALFWDGKQYEIAANLFMGTAFFPRQLYLDSGGAKASQGCWDQIVAARIPDWITRAPEPRNCSMLYRWGHSGIHHDSGTGYEGKTPEDKLREHREFIKRTLTPGPQTVGAWWARDYVKETREHLERVGR